MGLLLRLSTLYLQESEQRVSSWEPVVKPDTPHCFKIKCYKLDSQIGSIVFYLSDTPVEKYFINLKGKINGVQVIRCENML